MSSDDGDEFALLESDEDASAGGDSSGSEFAPSDGKPAVLCQTM